MSGWAIRARLIACVLLMAACGTAAPSPPPATPTPAARVTSAPPTVPPDQEAALAELCDPTNEAGLSNLVGELEGLSETADAQRLAEPIEQAMTNLRALRLGPDGMSVRDSAIGLMGDLVRGVDDPATRGATITAAAQSMRNLEAEVCSSPEM